MKKVTGKKLRGPSRVSLREMPEVNFDKAKVACMRYTPNENCAQTFRTVFFDCMTRPQPNGGR